VTGRPIGEDGVVEADDDRDDDRDDDGRA
jgi:hypothetical protein